ncbi:hypothetical protein EKK58_01350 [Candidatus Dependentiae bacterium]|nr:MAG: hypothetical protein EKK58_01350 [Candidatus Dependentiae bacterium]
METVAQTQLRLETFIKDYCAQPSVNLQVDLSPGSVLSELLIKLSSELHNQLKLDVETVAPATSVQAALNATGDTYSEAIDAVASNFNVVRDQGKTVTGTVKIQVSSQRAYYISNNFQLIHPSSGAVYGSTQTYRADPTVTADDLSKGVLRLFREREGYYFLLPVVNTDAKSNVTVPHNSALILNAANTTLDSFVSARAFGNFTSGRPVETDRELIARFQTGLSTKGLVSPQSMQSLLPQVFPTLFTQSSEGKAILSVIGANDIELNRGRNTVYGITPFGLADVYVRTARSIKVDTFEVTAVYTGSNNVWTILLDETVDNFPTWFYDVVSLKYVDLNGVTQTAAVTNIAFDAASDAPNQLSGSNLVTSADVARFSKYQVCTVTATITNAKTSPVNGSTIAAQLTVSYMPGIGEIQDYFLQSANRVIAADYLIKAVIPCTLSTKLLLTRGAGPEDEATTKQAIRQAICDYVNGLTFGEEIAVSRIVDICHNFNVRRVDLPVSVTGSILVPTASSSSKFAPVETTDVLSVPYNPVFGKYGVSSKTTMFFIDYNDINGDDTILISMN